MKKVLLAVAGLLIAGVSFGQTKWGIVAGPQFSSYTTKGDNVSKQTSDLFTNVRAGITVDIPLAEEFYIGTGLLYSGKGGKDNGVKTNLSYLQVPVNFLFKPEVGTGKLNLGVGPYFAYGIAGKHKSTVGNAEVSVKAFDDEAGPGKLKKFDAGMGIVAGYELPVGLYLGLNADLGLINAFDNTDNGRAWHNTSFGVSVGYKF
ncbi:porin family protein [Chitinophaga sancti]|uniref:Outer membrane insertion C-terminal signal n=1 Tax=Chitinophaga sancti TaxID=1004 RepID=A0A1K1SUX8_9BACT|nr:porin family protein [Chitinophaga sancti]WQD60564.1 porin family protein [Chitinophaga sancti]WQG87308.1 porin family protein [Chitinophaga sancti]SFW87871.1 outer membrane insertion C-terminal signal [Chitinophaga sancti]